jgi:CRISPR-associated protein Cmr1
MNKRPIPEFPSTLPQRSSGLETREYSIELITPMFGGGVIGGENDPTFPIRPTAIRGQLQFWWRATEGAKYASTKELREAQTEVWGSTKKSSAVTVSVVTESVAKPVACAKFEKDLRNPGQLRSTATWNVPFLNTNLPYVLFPFQGQRSQDQVSVGKLPAECIHQSRFRLLVQCSSSLFSQVETSIWAWVNFGGLGSRTRRGCGAIFCSRFAPKSTDDLVTQWKTFLPKSYPERLWTTLAAGVWVANTTNNSLDAWNQVVDVYRSFRQGVGFARNPGERQPNKPGRSRFPEPETIREIKGLRVDRQKSQHERMSAIPADAFPRAELGLPIIYELRGAGEPPKVELRPLVAGKPVDRMGSALILKPLTLSNGSSLPIFLRMQAPAVNEVAIYQGKREIQRFGSIAIRGPRLATYGTSKWKSPLAMSASGSALEAFTIFACSTNNGFKKIF